MEYVGMGMLVAGEPFRIAQSLCYFCYRPTFGLRIYMRINNQMQVIGGSGAHGMRLIIKLLSGSYAAYLFKRQILR